MKIFDFKSIVVMLSFIFLVSVIDLLINYAYANEIDSYKFSNFLEVRLVNTEDMSFLIPISEINEDFLNHFRENKLKGSKINLTYSEIAPLKDHHIILKNSPNGSPADLILTNGTRFVVNNSDGLEEWVNIIYPFKGYIYIPSTFEYNMNNRRQSAKEQIEIWVYENLNLSYDGFSYEKAFVPRGRGLVWLVDIKIDGEVIKSIYVNDVTNEIKKVPAPKEFPSYSIEVNDMNITLLDSSILWTEVTPSLSAIKEAGEKVVLAIYNRFEVDLDGAVVRLMISSDVTEESRFVASFVYLEEYLDDGTTRTTEFYVTLNLVLQEILSIHRGPFRG